MSLAELLPPLVRIAKRPPRELGHVAVQSPKEHAPEHQLPTLDQVEKIRVRPADRGYAQTAEIAVELEADPFIVEAGLATDPTGIATVKHQLVDKLETAGSRSEESYRVLPRVLYVGEEFDEDTQVTTPRRTILRNVPEDEAAAIREVQLKEQWKDKNRVTTVDGALGWVTLQALDALTKDQEAIQKDPVIAYRAATAEHMLAGVHADAERITLG